LLPSALSSFSQARLSTSKPNSNRFFMFPN